MTTVFSACSKTVSKSKKHQELHYFVKITNLHGLHEVEIITALLCHEKYGKSFRYKCGVFPIPKGLNITTVDGTLITITEQDKRDIIVTAKASLDKYNKQLAKFKDPFSLDK